MVSLNRLRLRVAAAVRRSDDGRTHPNQLRLDPLRQLVPLARAELIRLCADPDDEVGRGRAGEGLEECEQQPVIELGRVRERQAVQPEQEGGQGAHGGLLVQRRTGMGVCGWSGDGS